MIEGQQAIKEGTATEVVNFKAKSIRLRPRPITWVTWLRLLKQEGNGPIDERLQSL